MNSEDVSDLLRLAWQFTGVIFVCGWLTWSKLSGYGPYVGDGSEFGNIVDFIRFIGNVILK